jgi:very-short-patch-repair endonuclease
MNYIGSDKHKENAKNALLKGRKKIHELKEDRIVKYNLNPKLCEYCNEPINYDKRNNKFCSSSCAASHNNKNRIVTDLHKLKTSLSLKGVEKGGNKKLKEYKRVCLNCNEEFIVSRRKNGSLSRQKYCCEKCSNEGMRLNLSIIQKEKVKNGTHKGWQFRKILSYPEKFFIKVLKNNNIKYQHNLPINKRNLGLNDSSNYFLDFYFEDKKIDLEIDGKQHTYEERKDSDETRDKNLNKNGIKVYRIKWKEISSKQGKEYIKSEIDKFITFYKNA